jgi:type IV pilus assembly protein PilV
MSPRFHAGVSLIEVLVAVVIVSLGVLSVVALQLVSKRNNLDSQQRTIASQLAFDMIERMRGNGGANALTVYLNESPHIVGYKNAQPAPACSSEATLCNTVETARFDLWEWAQNLRGASEQIIDGAQVDLVGGLVSPFACIEGPIGGTSGFYTVTIAWRSSLSLPANADPALACVQGTGLFGDADEFRRVMQVRAFITN